MAEKINEIFSKFAKGSPKGMSTGLGALLLTGGLIYGATQSVYTGLLYRLKNQTKI
jgi:hypothetical protein